MATMQQRAFSSKAASRQAVRVSRGSRVVRCQAQKTAFEQLSQRAAAAGAAAMLALGGLSGAAVASEFDILAETTAPKQHYYDDANVLSKSTRSEISKKLAGLEIETGYRLDLVTVRKLEFETDAFAFGDKVLENWWPTAEEGDKKGVLLLVTSGKEGAISGGRSFLAGVGDELLESVVTDNVPIFTEEEKYNAAATTSVDRLVAKLSDREVPEAPKRNDAERKRTYKTKEETEKTKTVTSTVVVTLLVIAVVVPMLQYYGYTARD